MQLVRSSPFRDLARMEKAFDKFWESDWGQFPTFAEAGAIDMYEEDGNLLAEVSLPNFKKGEVKITADEGVLEVSAEHKEKEEEKAKRHYFFRESSNQYFRRVILPEGVKADKAVASFKDGVLKITMPFTAQKKTKEIAVK